MVLQPFFRTMNDAGEPRNQGTRLVARLGAGQLEATLFCIAIGVAF